VGIRLDSGDLAYLAVQAAKMLNDAGFAETSIVLSNQLDEMVILQIIAQIQQEAPRYGVDADQVIDRLVYGVGTRLITSEGDAALDGVYKLVAVQEGDQWTPAIKISESPEKIPNPGNKRVWRIYDQRRQATADLITLEDEDPREMASIVLRHPNVREKQRTLSHEEVSEIEPLLDRILDSGETVYEPPPVEELRDRRKADLSRLDPGVKRIMNPHIYHVSLSEKLWSLKEGLVEEAKAR
jgi:nicotinate phosphoribosyltransferase